MDTLARALLVAAEMVDQDTLKRHRQARYAAWTDGLGTSIMSGDASLAGLEARVAAGEVDPRPVSGGQELLENLVNQQVWAADRHEP